MPLQPNGPAPYTTATAAITAIEAYRARGFGTPVTPEILTRAGVSESIARRTLHSLRALGLIEESGQPSPQFEELRLARGDEEYQARLQEWLRSVYADILQYADPSSHSLARVTEAFRSYEPAGQRQSMAALLIGLWKHAGLPVSTDASPPRASGVPARPRATPHRTPRVRIDDPLPPAVDGLPPGLLGLLQQIPRAGQAWTNDRREGFLKAFSAVLDFTVPVAENTSSATENESEEVEP